MIHWKYLLFLFILHSTTHTMAQVVPLSGAHAHNDYKHENPLFDALVNGFTSIEADVILLNDELFVGHELTDSSNHSLPRLVNLYLDPIDSIILQTGEIFIRDITNYAI